MGTARRLIRRIANTDYARAAVADQADLSGFRDKPTGRIITGLVIMGFSYVIGWPLISLLGVISVYAKEPLILAVGGPAAYGLSHLTFMLGMWLAGAKYVRIFLRWATRMFVEKMADKNLLAD